MLSQVSLASYRQLPERAIKQDIFLNCASRARASEGVLEVPWSDPGRSPSGLLKRFQARFPRPLR
eukprot:4545407-Alexandrium_andersonii.AAC.1